MKKYLVGENQKKRKDFLARYDGEIAYLDHHMGELFGKLSQLGIYDNTLIIITSDHGEFFGEHGLWYHSHELYEEVLKIPLIGGVKTAISINVIIEFFDFSPQKKYI